MHIDVKSLRYVSVYNIINVQRMYSEAACVGFSEQNGDGATIAAEVEQLEPDVGGSTS